MFYLFTNISFLVAFGTIVFLTIVPFFYFPKSKYFYLIPLIFTITLLYLGFRTASLSAVGIFALWLYLKHKFRWQYGAIALIICVAALFIKIGSTSGRWFITKRAIEILKENPKGIGFGNFKVTYGLHQADYFKSHPINDAIALGAENTQFAFNEYLQIAIEGGVFYGVLFFLCTIITLIVGIKLYRRKQEELLLVFITGFTGISFANLTFYMLHNYWVLAFYIICALGIYCSLLLYKRFATFFALLAVSILISIIGFKNYKHNFLYKKIETASILSSVGYKNDADSIFKNVSKDSADIGYQVKQARHYLNYNKAAEAISEMAKVNKQVTNDGNYLLTGDAYLAIGDTVNAIKCYLTAVYIVPKRFISRKKLVDIYRQTNNIKAEVFWLKSIVDLSEKVPSEITKQIKMYAKLRLNIFLQ